jgi:hypothetical protein
MPSHAPRFASGFGTNESIPNLKMFEEIYLGVRWSMVYAPEE